MTSTLFAMTGAAGGVAGRHLESIRAVGGRLVAALDPRDSVERLDAFDTRTRFFVDEGKFRADLDRRRASSSPTGPVDFLSVCSPSDLHVRHTLLGLDAGANVICEKPLCLDLRELDVLAEREARTGRRIVPVLQLRHNPTLQNLAETLRSEGPGRLRDVEVLYVSARGHWYDLSWKSDRARSGGVETNIGLHLFDVLIWLFGTVHDVSVEEASPRRVKGSFVFERARVRWLVSVDERDAPTPTAPGGRALCRRLRIDGSEFDFSAAGHTLHAQVYAAALNGTAIGLEEARASLAIAGRVRSAIAHGVGRSSDVRRFAGAP